MDILDRLGELDDDYLMGDDLVSSTANTPVADTDFTVDEAEQLTHAIRAAATATYVLLARAHEGKAYKTLGYDTWGEYVSQEFEMSPQRSYQLLDLSKVVQTIEAVAPEGTEVKLTEAQARDIKRELPRITEVITERLDDDVDPEDASWIIDDVISEVREQKKADDAVTKKREAEKEAAELEGYQKGLESAADAFLEEKGYDENGSGERSDRGYDPDQPETITSGAGTDTLEYEVDGAGDSSSPTAAMDLYNFITVLKGTANLPNPDDFIDDIPEDQFDMIYSDLFETSSWMNRMVSLMDDRKSS